jgi:hypothetical protein
MVKLMRGSTVYGRFLGPSKVLFLSFGDHISLITEVFLLVAIQPQALI